MDKVVQLLLEAEADARVKDRRLHSPADYAEKCGYSEIAKTLVQAAEDRQRAYEAWLEQQKLDQKGSMSKIERRRSSLLRTLTAPKPDTTQERRVSS